MAGYLMTLANILQYRGLIFAQVKTFRASRVESTATGRCDQVGHKTRYSFQFVFLGKFQH